MPVVSMFYGLSASSFSMPNSTMSHLHAEYGEMNAVFQAWIELHRDELLADWKLAMEGQPMFPIDPLK
ncbi:MAG: DUF4160 domain-containing protein [Magnetococcales bacterium]|nr:DUF4160 domain-containing protein [Magnetococcales bacterium]MBF0115177.1 DUF4160 domain-containing protein [Magnetococcales bacterium]